MLVPALRAGVTAHALHYARVVLALTLNPSDTVHLAIFSCHSDIGEISIVDDYALFGWLWLVLVLICC